jgi:hypothetical protein
MGRPPRSVRGSGRPPMSVPADAVAARTWRSVHVAGARFDGHGKDGAPRPPRLGRGRSGAWRSAWPPLSRAGARPRSGSGRQPRCQWSSPCLRRWRATFWPARGGVDAVAFVSMVAPLALGQGLPNAVIAVMHAGSTVLEGLSPSPGALRCRMPGDVGSGSGFRVRPWSRRRWNHTRKQQVEERRWNRSGLHPLWFVPYSVDVRSKRANTCRITPSPSA